MITPRRVGASGAFTLVELLVVLVIVGVLSGVALPVYARITQGARATACVSNLRQLGAALSLYLNEHNTQMPALLAGRELRSDPGPVIDDTLVAYVADPRIFACPADTADLARQSGTSYYWNVLLNGQFASTLHMLNLPAGSSQIPVLSDKGSFHPYQPNKVNILYADGHAEKNFNFSTGMETAKIDGAEPMIRLEGLTKSFSGRVALEPLTLEVRAGEVFGLLGHNGAGKSTTFGLILGHLAPSGGEAFVRGISVRRDRPHALRGVGAIFETPAFYDYLSGWRNLTMLTALSGRVTTDEIEETVRYVGLEERIHSLVRVYSHGMRQRLALAQALLPRPDLILLDEPAEGLDPEGIREMRELILRLNRERGLTVVLSSHLLSEVEQTCDRVAILHRGRLVFQGQWESLATDAQRFHLEVDDWSAAAQVVATLGGGLDGDRTATLPSGADVADLVDALVGARVRVRAVEPVRQTLEEVYLRTVADIRRHDGENRPAVLQTSDASRQ